MEDQELEQLADVEHPYRERQRDDERQPHLHLVGLLQIAHMYRREQLYHPVNRQQEEPRRNQYPRRIELRPLEQADGNPHRHNLQA